MPCGRLRIGEEHILLAYCRTHMLLQKVDVMQVEKDVYDMLLRIY